MVKKQLSKIVKRIGSKKQTIKLNVGCGTDYKKGWINIDNNSDDNIEKLDLNFDLREQLPYEDGTVDYIFNEHFIEHLTIAESQKSIKDFMRVLKKGGVLRIAMPDLSSAVELYHDPDWKKKPFIKKHGLDFVKTNAEMLNLSFSAWGHKWLYDWEELERRLKEAGCTNIRKGTKGASLHKDLKGLEIRDESTLIAEVTK